MFQNVDQNKKYSIQDVVPLSGFKGWGQEQIQILDKDGNVEAEKYQWLCSDAADGYGDAGWYTLNFQPADRPIANGESFLLFNENEKGFSVQFAGQVNYASTKTSSTGGFILIGNATPVEMDIQKFVLDPGFKGWGQEQIQILDKNGNVETKDKYQYLSAEAADGYGSAGWYTMDFQYANRKFAAGEGFLLFSESPVVITIPAVTK